MKLEVQTEPRRFTTKRSYLSGEEVGTDIQLISKAFHSGEYIIKADGKLFLVTAYHDTDTPFLSVREIVSGKFPHMMIGDSYRIYQEDVEQIIFYERRIVKFYPVKRIINSRTSTIKYPTPQNDFKRPLKAILRYDALTAILVGTNPLRGEYEFSDEDYKHIEEVKENIMTEIMLLENYLYQRRKNPKAGE